MPTRKGLCNHIKEVHNIKLPRATETESPPKHKSRIESGDIHKKEDKGKLCPFCLFTAPHTSRLDRHVKAVHLKIKDLK